MKHKASCMRKHNGGSGKKQRLQKAALPPASKAGMKKKKRKEKGPSTDGNPAAAEVAPRPSKPHIPCNVEDHILLIGEGNFSFGAALAGVIGSAELLVATSYDTEEEIAAKYSDAREHMETITDLGGSVMHGVDARNLQGNKALRGRRFSKIIFNFPHAGAGIKDQDRNIISNQQLLSSFLVSAKPLLSHPATGQVYTARGPASLPHGEVHITLKSGLPYDEWGVVALAASAGYKAKACLEFRPEWYPAYEHRRTIGFDATKAGNEELKGKTCKTWVFVSNPFGNRVVAAAGQQNQQWGSGPAGGRGGKGAAAAHEADDSGKKRGRADSDSD